MELQRSGWLSRTESAIPPFSAGAENHACKAAGRDGGRGRILDFFVASSPLLGAMKATPFDFAFPWRPHAVVRTAQAADLGKVSIIRARRPSPLTPAGGTPGQMTWTDAVPRAASHLSARGFWVNVARGVDGHSGVTCDTALVCTAATTQRL